MIRLAASVETDSSRLAGDLVDQVLGRERLVGIGYDALVEFLQVASDPAASFALMAVTSSSVMMIRGWLAAVSFE